MSTTRRSRARRIFRSESLEPKVLLAADIAASRVSTVDGETATAFPQPDRAFVALPVDTRGTDPVLAGGVVGQPGDLQELDVVHLGGTPNGPLGSYLVAGVGTGTAAQFSSWKVTGDNPQPTHLRDADVLTGMDFQVHVVSPQENPELARRPFLISRINSAGQLWIGSYHLSIQGSFVADDLQGFGDIDVLSHAVAHRPAADGDSWSQVVTPVIGRNGDGQLELRVVTWRVHVQTQQINGLQASPPIDVTGLRDAETELTVHHTSFSSYTISFKNTSNRLVNRYVVIGDEGQVLDAGGGASGKTFQGSPRFLTTDHLAAAPLNADASVSLTDENDELKLTVWERRVDQCFFFLCTYDAYELGTSDNDQNPNLRGITIDGPDLTHAYEPTPGTNEFFGTAIAVGDFNGDGHNDLAAGAPGQDVNGAAAAGAVTVLYGSADGLYNSPYNATWTQASPGILGAANQADHFGQTVVAGDFNGDGRDDVAIGVPGESIEADNLSEVGVVHILYGSPTGIGAANNALLRQGVNGVKGLSEANDHFAASLAVGDFDGDGRDDLAVGIPDEDHNQQNIIDAGAVHIFYGAPGGLDAAGDNVTFHQDSGGILEDAEAGDEFGYDLTTGDFNHDGRDDLAIGVPGERAFGMSDTGGVQIVLGSAAGLSTLDQFITQDGIRTNANTVMGDISDGTEANDRFGETLAAGDFNGDGFRDLAIGVPLEDANGMVNSGRVHMLLGSNIGITHVGEEVFDQSTTGVLSDPEIGGRFGSALTTGDVHHDGMDDLLIGLPFQDHSASSLVTYANTGIAILLKGTQGSALTGIGSKMLKQGTNGIGDSPSAGDHFAAAIALADLNDDGFDDAIVGVPNELRSRFSSDYSNAGAVHIIEADADGFTSADELWGQGTARHIRAMAANGNWERAFGVGNGTLFELMPSGEPAAVHAASVTKATTLFLTVLALEEPNSPVSLSDQITISQKAAETGGSKMTGTQDGEEALLEEGDVLTLESLLYGMMIHSGNRASVAIGEHIGVHMLNADPNDPEEPMARFVDEMNDLGQLLHLNDTRYGHPAGGSVTTPQDLITMWRAAWQHPRFRQFASSENSFEAVTLNLNPPKVFALNRTNSYVGQDGWKGGHGRVGDVYDEQGQLIEVPICTQCHVGQARRGGHTVVVGIQQSKDDIQNAWELYDYSFERLFTPDRRGRSAPPSGMDVVGPGVRMSDIQSIALDHVTDSWIVTAAIDDEQHVQLVTWSVDVNAGTVASIGGVIETVDHLPAGDSNASQTLDLARLPEQPHVVGDYVTGSIENGNLRLDVWRLGAEVVPPPRPPTTVVGDFNSDQRVDEGDIQRLCQELSAPRKSLAFDVNGDQTVDRRDMDALIHDVLETSYGDANLDGKFDPDDFVKVFIEGKYSRPSREPAQWSQGDWNCDGVFDHNDIVTAFIDGGYVGGATATAASQLTDMSRARSALDGRLPHVGIDPVGRDSVDTTRRLSARRAALLASASHDAIFANFDQSSASDERLATAHAAAETLGSLQLELSLPF